jgi:hypothetical protein
VDFTSFFDLGLLYELYVKIVQMKIRQELGIVFSSEGEPKI